MYVVYAGGRSVWAIVVAVDVVVADAEGGRWKAAAPLRFTPGVVAVVVAGKEGRTGVCTILVEAENPPRALTCDNLFSIWFMIILRKKGQCEVEE